MATIERIRKRSGVLIVVVFVALMAFVLGDLFRAGGSKFFGDPNVIGSVNGEDISRLELSQGIEDLKAANPQQYGNMTNVQLSNFVWNTLVAEKLLSSELARSGMTVGPREIYLDMIGNPNIRQSFAGADGQFDENLFNSYINQIRQSKDATEQSAQAWAQWMTFEEAIIGQSKNNKFVNAISQALFMPAGLAKIENDRNQAAHATRYVYVPYSAVDEAELAVDEAAAKKYYNANRDLFEQEEGRNIEYINFPLQPSASDFDAVRAELAALTLEWMNTEDDSVFVNLHSDVRFNPTYVTMNDIKGTGLDTLVEGQETGYIRGPIELGNSFAVVKITGMKQLADSVQARHILIPYAGAQGSDASVTRSPREAKELADSLYAYLQDNRSAFVEVSDAYSSDVISRGKGGDLGFFSRGMMTPAFDRYCFNGKEGDLGLVPTEFGFHIVEITDQMGSNTAYQIGQLIREVLPSDETIQKLYSKASTFAAEAQSAEDYRALASEMSLTLRPAQNLGRMDESVPGLGNSRRVVRWAWEDERQEGNIGLLENDGKGYVVVVLTNILEEGTTPFELVADKCLLQAEKEARERILVERFEAAMKSASSIDEVAAALEEEVSTFSMRIGNPSIPGIGSEPEVIGALCGLEDGEMSDVLAGETGVFVGLAGAVTPAPEADYATRAQTAQTALRNLVSVQAYQALENKSKIEDKRYMMY